MVERGIIMDDYATCNLSLFRKDLSLIRSALISKETEERNLMQSCEGAKYYDHLDVAQRCELLRYKFDL